MGINSEKLFYKKRLLTVCGLPVSMAKDVSVEQSLRHVLDLSLTRYDGAFLCPRCGLLLSPDDETADNYSILEIKIKEDFLDELLVQCQRCRSEIRLVGLFKFGE